MTTVPSAGGTRAVFGVPLYNSVRRGHFEEALESLLAQTYPHVAFVFVDDGSTDGTPDVVAAVAARDRRVALDRNPRRLGLVENWIRAFRLARQRFPDAAYFAWGSDHDRWESRWLERLVQELDDHPGAVLAFPGFTRIDHHGVLLKNSQSLRSSSGLTRQQRFTAACTKIGAGKLIYGLFRAPMLEKAGIYPLVYQPDVYIMLELSLYGGFRTIPDTLWHWREGSRGSTGVEAVRSAPSAPQLLVLSRWLERMGRRLGLVGVKPQHRHIFTGRVPWYSRLPAWIQHFCLLCWRLVLCGRGRPIIGRLEAVKYARRFLALRLLGEKDTKKARRQRRERARQMNDLKSDGFPRRD